MHSVSMSFNWIVGCSVIALISTLLFASTARAADPRPVEDLVSYNPAELFSVVNGSVEKAKVDGQDALRWSIAPGQVSELAIRRDHPIFAQLRSFDRLQFDFRIASGAINTIEVRALGHVSGPRASREHQGEVALLTTLRGVWHTREWDFNRPTWLPWIKEDGEGTDAYFLLGSLGLEPGTVVELRNMRFVRALVQVKPAFDSPITWPVKTENADGSVTYNTDIHVLNSSTKPTTINAKIATTHTRFKVALDKNSIDVKNGKTAIFKLSATLSKADIDAMPELTAEPLRIAFVPASAPDAESWYMTNLVRPLGKGLRTQVLVKDDDLKFIRDKIAAGDKEVATITNMARLAAAADKFLPVKLVKVPTQTGHSMNNYPEGWAMGDFMPEIVNTKTGERQACNSLAGIWWQAFLNYPGEALDSLGMMYLLTGDEKYAQKGVDLMKLYGEQYEELPWNATGFGNPQGATVLSTSRVSATSSYGTNWLFKGHLRMLSAISQSKAWAEAPRAKIYNGFVLPYSAELMKFPGGISNMTDITNHNLLLLGLIFDDAGLVYFATKSDPGLTSRLRDITADGFSSEGRPLGYHFAAMAEYLPSINYLENSGLKLDYPKERIPAAIRMAYQRASLTGSIPSTGDCARGLLVRNQPLTDHLITIFPQEKWLFDIGGDSTLAKKVRLFQAGAKPNPDAWKSLLETKPHLFAEAGLAILRTGETADKQVSVTLDYGRNFFHAALDRLQFTITAYGVIYSQGPGSLYNVGRGGMTRNDNKQLDTFINHDSLSNNLVVVDATNQALAIGKLLAWNDKPEMQVAVASAAVRTGVSHTRGVALTDGLVFVFDRLVSEQEHTYDFVYHNFGKLKLPAEWTSTPVKEPLAKTGNYENIIDLARLKGTGPIHLEWDLTDQKIPENKLAAAGPIGLALWQIPAANGEAYTGTTGLNNSNTGMIPDAAPSLFQRTKGKTAEFFTVLEPYAGTPRVKSIAVNGDALSATLVDGKTVTLSLSKLIKDFPAAGK